MDPKDGRYDGVFHQIVQTGGGYEAIFDELFSWFRRKTDFFSDQKKAEVVIAQAGEKHAKLWKEDEESRKSTEVEKNKREAERKKVVEVAEEKKKAAAMEKAEK